MIVHVINLESRTVRMEQFHQESIQQGFEYVRHEGEVFRHDRKQGVCRSHKAIVRQAKENGDEMVIVCEDDCRWFGKGAFDYFISKIPEDFDLFLTMAYVAELDADNRIKGVFSGLTCYIVHSRFYDFYLSLPDSCHLDRELGLYAKDYKFIVCDQFTAEQDGSRSDNTMMQCDYRPYLQGRKLFNNGERTIYPIEQPL